MGPPVRGAGLAGGRRTWVQPQRVFLKEAQASLQGAPAFVERAGVGGDVFVLNDGRALRK